MKNIYILVLIVLLFGGLIWFLNEQNKKQIALISEQNRQNKTGGTNEALACSKDWLCATTSILGGLGGLTKGMFSLNVGNK